VHTTAIIRVNPPSPGINFNTAGRPGSFIWGSDIVVVHCTLTVCMCIVQTGRLYAASVVNREVPMWQTPAT